MNQRPLLPGTRAFTPIRVGLAVLSLVIILADQFTANGTIYILTFMGLAGGFIFLLKDALEASGRAVHAVALVAPLLTMAMFFLVYAGLLSGLCTSVYCAVARRLPFTAARLTTTIFAFLAVSTALGLISMYWLEARPEFHGTPLFAPYFFLWPAMFTLLAVAYTKLFPKPRKA